MAPHSDATDSGDNDPPTPSIDFVTLGMFIIDDIDFLPPTPPAKDVLGGAGTYSALGARLLSPPPLSGSVGWVVDQGSDFPPALGALIDTWGTHAVHRLDAERLTTRGWNGYDSALDQHRAFRYTTPKRRLTGADLDPALLRARSFHLICSPLRCQELVRDITSRRRAVMPGETYTKPIFIWEPVPDRCHPDELLNCTNCLPLVDVCSPNHAELAAFLGTDGLDPATGAIDPDAVEQACEQLLASMPLQSYALVVRAGERGCYVARNGGRRRPPRRRRDTDVKPARRKALIHGSLQPDTDMESLLAGLLQGDDGAVDAEEIEVDPGVQRWIPAYHQDAANVVDPTGGGNTFLGGLAVALAREEDVETAAVWGTVAASFAIEQVGPPTIGKSDDAEETWNGVNPLVRLHEFQERL
ncbi:MAK32-like protein [Cordyceps fumosorosea ARSEF 2679]|uniref:MAK32-like protein n=1 Tax=Cordyceps fumosorosea (strain ARSEF 2679) TaxID=1081104 RepID=A0A168AQV9_CORFA|nr:MAK32-like protein [Cordyceps fumosorosea ARSEF 2679]OAA69071.1 MAK32-like protein [Cordyceps fumosorosea ARSEF 2679]